jgi:tRNA-specific 2-thiouridylase
VSENPPVIVALSGGVDSAVAALELVRQGYQVECLHMTNWEDDDGYCQSALDYQDARRTADALGVPLHRVNLSSEYYKLVFEDFLREHERGRTPNPDVLCNREIKFSAMQQYARRLGGELLATGHYARLGAPSELPSLLKGIDDSKDQSYFLHAVDRDAFRSTLFPLGDLKKDQVRAMAQEAGLAVAAKKDSTGICFIGERPFTAFLARYLPENPGPIVTLLAEEIGQHQGLAFYTLGQRQGLNIGGLRYHGSAPWYVAAKHADSNELLVVQDPNHPLLFQDWLQAGAMNWTAPIPAAWDAGDPIACTAKTRYRQIDRPCLLRRSGEQSVEAWFESPQRAITPGQYVVFYDGATCLGGARIDHARMRDQN